MSSSSSSSSSQPTPTACPGLSKFSEITVTIEGNDYHVPAEGDPLNLILKDGTDLVITPRQIQIGGASGTVPREPPSMPSPTLIGGTQVTFKERALDFPSLAPPDSPTGRDYAKRVAQDYIQLCNETNHPAAAFLNAVIDLFARYDAPSPAEAVQLLGTEAAALSNVSSTAQKVLGYFDEGRMTAWDGFLLQASLYNMTSPTSGIPSLPTRAPLQKKAGAGSAGKTYIQVAFSGLPGIEDLCQRVPWRMESFLNLARFFSNPQPEPKILVPHLQKYRSQLMNTTAPGGPIGLKLGGGAMVYGAAAFDMISRVQLDNKTDLFGFRGWGVTIAHQPLWYFRSMTKFFDGGGGPELGTIPAVIHMELFTYVLGMDLTPGSTLQRALLDINGRFWRFERRETLEERHQRLGVGVDDQRMWQEARIENENLRESYMDAPQRYSSQTKRATEEIPLPPAWPWQRLLSAKSTDQQPLKDQTYKRDDALGNGITVFVLDSGFDISGPNAAELRVDPNNPKRNTWIVPNILSMGLVPQSQWVPEVMDDPATAEFQVRDPANSIRNQGHGTSVASLAIGTEYGIASRADSYLVKLSGIYKDTNGKYIMIKPVFENLQWGYEHIADIIKERNLQGKAVINFSGTTERDPYNSLNFLMTEKLSLDYMDEFSRLGVSFVVSAGNDGDVGLGYKYMGNFLPQSLGRSDNALITVGSVYDDGKFYRGTSLPGPGWLPNGPQGSMTVWAQGVDVDCLRPDGRVQWRRTGTSFAAPQVAGLIANWMSEDPDKFQWKPGYTDQDGIDLVMRIKKHLVDLSYDRHLHKDHIPTDGPIVYPVPTPINVAYNGAWGPQIRRTTTTSSSVSFWTTIWMETPTSTPSTTTDDTTSTSTYSAPPWESIVNNAACKNPPKCDQCIDGFQLKCRKDPHGDNTNVCQCEWESGCASFRYGDCADLDCSLHDRQSFHCDKKADPGMYPDGHCYCRDAPCRVGACPKMDCGGLPCQPVCDPHEEE
ncbi:hypothetical protein PG984_005452 [Apiospora sp. TS-2023a]